MTLKEYIPRGGRTAFAKRVGIGTDYIHQICAGTRRPTNELAVRISAATNGQVAIETLCPLEGGEPYPLAARLRESDPIPTPEEVRRRAARMLAEDDSRQIDLFEEGAA